MSLSTRRRGAVARLSIAALAAVGALALSSCGNSGAGAAAVMGSSRVLSSDLQLATTEINEAAGGQGGVPSSAVLGWLVLAPYVLPAAGEREAVASQDDACRLLASLAGQSQAADATAGTDGAPVLPDCTRNPFAEPTLRAVSTWLSVGQSVQTMSSIDEVNTWWEQILDEAQADGLEVNPRFGEFRRTAGTDQAADVSALTGELLAVVGPATPNWLEATEPAAEPSPSP